MISIDINIAKNIVHTIRRQQREQEFAPLDKEIQLRIPTTDLDAVEAQRQAVRDRYAEIQSAIDSAVDATELKIIAESLINK
jgi:predicted DNA binding CopG/RHH family protein